MRVLIPVYFRPGVGKKCPVLLWNRAGRGTEAKRRTGTTLKGVGARTGFGCTNVYLRASTEDQFADRAKEMLEQFVQEREHKRASYYRENISGTKVVQFAGQLRADAQLVPLLKQPLEVGCDLTRKTSLAFYGL